MSKQCCEMSDQLLFWSDIFAGQVHFRHFDLAVAWLYAEYSIAEGYLQSTQNNLQYDSCLTGLLKGAKAKLDTRDRYVVGHHSPCIQELQHIC